jgi:hypothetical protein
MLRYLIILALVLSGNSYADMVAARASFAPPPPTYTIPLAGIEAHYLALKKTRALNIIEASSDNLATVAATLKVENIISLTQDMAHNFSSDIGNAIIAKIKQHPKWDMSLSAADLQSITPHLELLKTTLGEKSYGHAWFLKQTGKTAEAKQILMTLFDQRCASVMKMSGTYNQQNPMMPVIEVELALLPLSTETEKKKVQKKMQEVKVHVSNLKDYQIMT